MAQCQMLYQQSHKNCTCPDVSSCSQRRGCRNNGATVTRGSYEGQLLSLLRDLMCGRRDRKGACVCVFVFSYAPFLCGKVLARRNPILAGSALVSGTSFLWSRTSFRGPLITGCTGWSAILTVEPDLLKRGCNGVTSRWQSLRIQKAEAKCTIVWQAKV